MPRVKHYPVTGVDIERSNLILCFRSNLRIWKETMRVTQKPKLFWFIGILPPFCLHLMGVQRSATSSVSDIRKNDAFAY